MTDQELIEKGYFAKELPPPFQTKLFADKLGEIKADFHKITSEKRSKNDKSLFNEKYRESKWVVHSIPKVGFSRRLLGIPNPYHQCILSKSIADSWAEIEAIFNRSIMSNSKPVEDKTGSRALKTVNTFGVFKQECLINSFDKLFEVKTDVSRYYATIYTHTIPWIMHTKAVAKTNRNDLSLLGNKLDKNLRDCNSGQTLGIPVGPDTSLVVAEIIGCTLDEKIQKNFKASIKGFRYLDDYYIYCKNQVDAEKAFKFIQSIFTEYELDINEEKTRITKSPFPFETDWSTDLGSFHFRKHAQSQQTDMERFVSLAFKNANNNPKEPVLNFAISILKRIALFDENWKLYQSLILKMALTEPIILPVVAEILVSHRAKVEKQKVKNVVKNIIEEHISKGHHFEVSWALWICKEFKIKLPNEIADLIFKSNDVISILIALDLKNDGYINSKVSTSIIESELTTESLMDTKWLLTYEAITQGWLPSPGENPIQNNEYFKILHKHKVQFYDKARTVIPFEPISPTISEKKPRTALTETEYEPARTGEPLGRVPGY